MADKTCDTNGCPNPAGKGERLCKVCKHAMLTEMKAAGYLTRLPGPRKYRTHDMCEDRYETVYGGNR